MMNAVHCPRVFVSSVWKNENATQSIRTLFNQMAYIYFIIIKAAAQR